MRAPSYGDTYGGTEDLAIDRPTAPYSTPGYTPDAGDYSDGSGSGAGSGAGYPPPSGNTGTSGFLPGGRPLPPFDPTGGAQAPSQQAPQFNGNYEEYFRSILGNGPSSMGYGMQHKDELERYGGKLQIASDGTWRGRITDIPGIGNMTMLGDHQSWGDPWAYRTGAEQYGSGGGGGGPQMVENSLPPGDPDWSRKLKDSLAGLFPGGAYNQDVVNRRTENARQDLERFNSSKKANNRAYLADRGLIGSGPEATEAFSREEGIADRYTQAASGIYADESENADSRMMQALALATGMSADEAAQAIQLFRAKNDFTLGQGNLALGNSRNTNDYNLGLANYGLNRDQALWQMDNGDTDQLIELIKTLMGGADISSGGHF